jgi:hypothetical protein
MVCDSNAERVVRVVADILVLAARVPLWFCQNEPLYVAGSSLQPFVHNGQTLAGRFSKDCPDPQRGDLMLFRHQGIKLPVLKIVVGIPGDRWGLKADGDL